ncbi:copper transporter [Gymnopilus junonius]|uniref:Copper transport protein n=1 Tax=Gymnopilus junonius TaxID=109634 RepID=A0A9P5NLT7_GYMJU|nr:copper transporter [Gymnopilus junonius]
MDHGGHDMPMAKCKMNMLWNTDIIDTCIVFRSWHISSNTTFLLSILAIIGLGVLYEYLRVFQRQLDVRIAVTLSSSNASNGKARSRDRSPPTHSVHSATHDAGLLSGRRLIKNSLTGVPVPFLFRALRAVVYGSTVFLSFFLMLVFMTYNAYLIGAVVVGAALGHYIFGATINPDAILSDSAQGKGMACH